MSTKDEYVAVQRCQTWNVWPASTVFEYRPFMIRYGEDDVPARLAVLSYENRTEATKYSEEGTDTGSLVWDGTVSGFHHVRDTIFMAPASGAELALQLRHARKGEIDVCINFKFHGELPDALVETVRATALATISLLNLHLQDYLTVSAPAHLRKVMPEGC